MTLLRDTPDDLFALFPLAAAHAGVSNLAFVEKEYWALEVLRSLQTPLPRVDVSPTVVFKGGTSLSRALHLTRRFSDDIDVMLNYGGELGKTGRDREILKTLATRVTSDLASTVAVEQSTEGFKRNVRFTYPTRFAAGAHSSGVLLEMAIRGDQSLLPGTERVTIQSYVGAYLDEAGEDAYDDTTPFEVLVLSPVRTLIEKVSLLHGKAAAWADTGQPPTDVGRHYYDVHRLLSDERVREALSALPRSDYLDICNAMDAATTEMRRTPPSRPDRGYATSLAFTVSDAYRDVLVAEFIAAEGLVYDAMPSIDECCDAVRAHADALAFEA